MTIPEYLTFCRAERAIITEIRAHISPLSLQTVKSDFSSEFLIFKHTVPLKIAWLFPKHISEKKKIFTRIQYFIHYTEIFKEILVRKHESLSTSTKGLIKKLIISMMDHN